MSIEKPKKGSPRGAFPYSPQGWPFTIAVLIASLLAYLYGPMWLWLLCSGLTAFVLNFFRDPQRCCSESDVYVSPADGKVIDAHAEGEGLRVNIFMNVFDVHVNTAPMAGKVTKMTYIPGAFVNASFDEACDVNERHRIEMQTEKGETIVFTQIAGLVARRIIRYVDTGDRLEAGQRVGMIRFGSRVDNEIPKGFELCVKQGDKVTAGQTVLARRIG